MPYRGGTGLFSLRKTWGLWLAKSHCDRVSATTSVFAFYHIIPPLLPAPPSICHWHYIMFAVDSFVKIRHLKRSRWKVTAQNRSTISALKLFVTYSQHATGSAKKGSGHSLLISLFERVYDIPLCVSGTSRLVHAILTGHITPETGFPLRLQQRRNVIELVKFTFCAHVVNP